MGSLAGEGCSVDAGLSLELGEMKIFPVCEDTESASPVCVSVSD